MTKQVLKRTKEEEEEDDDDAKKRWRDRSSEMSDQMARADDFTCVEFSVPHKNASRVSLR